MGMKRNRRELEAAWAADELVLLRRNIWKADVIEGFVVDLAGDWVVLHVVYDVGLNGWSVVRLDTVRTVEREPANSFLPRALAQFGEEPAPVLVDLTSPVDIIRSLAATFPLLTLLAEIDDPRAAAVGRPTRTGKKKVDLLEITPEGTWDGREPRRLRFADITRVDVGGRYEQALHELGGYPPIPG
jgi:hypothetical protein